MSGMPSPRPTPAPTLIGVSLLVSLLEGLTVVLGTEDDAVEGGGVGVLTPVLSVLAAAAAAVRLK